MVVELCKTKGALSLAPLPLRSTERENRDVENTTSKRRFPSAGNTAGLAAVGDRLSIDDFSRYVIPDQESHETQDFLLYKKAGRDQYVFDSFKLLTT